MNDLVGTIINYEDGELDPVEEVELFASLIASGSAWTLQGSYGRRARDYIEAGIIDRDGNIDWAAVQAASEFWEES